MEEYPGPRDRRRSVQPPLAPVIFIHFIFTVVIRWTVSMVDGHLFDRIAAVADQLRRKTDRPFGGIQVGSLFIIILY